MSANEVPWAVMQAKTLFTSCTDIDTINELNLSPLFDLLKLLNLPVHPDSIADKTSNYIEQLARIERILDINIFFGFAVARNPRNNSENIMYFYVPFYSNPFPTIESKVLEKRLRIIKSRLRKLDDFDDEAMLDKDEEAELAYMIEVIKHVISNGTGTECISEDEFIIFEEKIEDFVKMLNGISNLLHSMAREEQNQSISIENLSDSDYMMVDDLQKLTDEYVLEIDSYLTPKPIWRPFIESLFEGIVELDLDKKDKLLIGNLGYLKNVALMLTMLEEKDLVSYMWWTIVDLFVPFSSNKLRTIWDDYVHQIIEVEGSESLSMECASLVNNVMGMAVSWLFVDPTFHNNEANKVREMLKDIREAFASLVIKTDWMDQSTKTATLEKNQKMISEIGFPTWLFNEEKLNDFYKGINLSETNYLANIIQISQQQLVTTWASLHSNNVYNESYWATDPTDVNALHTFHLNHITIPAGILQFPFYELGLEVLNYGAIGTVLGHELTHGFDNTGRHYDSDGNIRQWWTNDTISEYSDKIQCFIDHYNFYYEEEVDEFIDGELTLDENIADNGGLHEAIVAYQKWKTRHGREPLLPGFTQFTHEQLFFLSYAHLWCESYTPRYLKWILESTHSPGHVRLEAVLKNSKEFSTAWNCPVGSNMNPSEKCHVW